VKGEGLETLIGWGGTGTLDFEGKKVKGGGCKPDGLDGSCPERLQAQSPQKKSRRSVWRGKHKKKKRGLSRLVGMGQIRKQWVCTTEKRVRARSTWFAEILFYNDDTNHEEHPGVKFKEKDSTLKVRV